MVLALSSSKAAEVLHEIKKFAFWSPQSMSWLLNPLETEEQR